MGARQFSMIIVTVAAMLSAPPRTGFAWAEGADEPRGASQGSAAVPEDDVLLAKYLPPAVDGPALRVPGSPTFLYVDATLAKSDDLSALPYIAGRGRNLQFALGGAWRWHELTFTGELPFTQVSTLDVTEIPGGMPIPPDMHQTAVSLGDVRLGVDWARRLSPELVGGVGLRTRFPTHTTRFQFHLIDGSLASYSFPYYFHVDPTVMLGAAFGRLVMIVNQGAVVLLGPDGDFGDQHIVVPTIVFWDAHYVVSYAPVDFLAASVELATDIQVNHVAGLDFQRLNDVRSVWVAPALSLHAGDYRLDLIARLGLTRGADLFGVIEYAGTRSYTLRLSRTFN